MKKLNKKGFTLIELLAVIVLMGILMFVAIPAVSRTIENSRRDTFRDTAVQYANHVKTLWAADGIQCTDAVDGTVRVSTALSDGNYYVIIDSQNAGSTVTRTDVSGTSSGLNVPILLEQGGKSSWGNREVKGIVKINVLNSDSTFYVGITDGIHGIDNASVFGGTPVLSENLGRGNVAISGIDYADYEAFTEEITDTICTEV